MVNITIIQPWIIHHMIKTNDLLSCREIITYGTTNICTCCDVFIHNRVTCYHVSKSPVVVYRHSSHWDHIIWYPLFNISSASPLHIRHQMEIYSALLAICESNPPVTGGFPSKRPVTRSFDVFVDMRLVKRLSIQRRRWWIETLSRYLWRHCNGTCYHKYRCHDNQRW